MTHCDEAKELLNDYVDELLDDSEHNKVEQHLGECADCTETVRALQAQQRAATDLSGGLQPGRDLWPGIEQRIAPEEVRFDPARRRVRFPIFQVVGLAAALAVVVFGLALLYTPVSIDWSEPLEPLAARATPDEPELSVEVELVTARDDLLFAFNIQEDAMLPTVAETVHNNLRIIDQTLADIGAALREFPSDPGLERLLYAAYNHEIDLLQRAMRLVDDE
ncbi:MAG: zf-HC2 domain-containing protein [Candidatus Hydrogenedentes bacterium]|nr:zf-HC2 domain-containing protein [Candidatus Hydrogenedentota bacterium]